MNNSDFKVGMLAIGIILFAIILALANSGFSIVLGIIGLVILIRMCVDV